MALLKIVEYPLFSQEGDDYKDYFLSHLWLPMTMAYQVMCEGEKNQIWVSKCMHVDSQILTLLPHSSHVYCL